MTAFIFYVCRSITVNNEKILAAPVTRWTPEEIKAIAKLMRKTDPVLIAVRKNKSNKDNKKKSQ